MLLIMESPSKNIHRQQGNMALDANLGEEAV